jgi:hypothetical protein
MKLMNQTYGRYLWATKFIGPVVCSVTDENDQWVPIFRGFRIWRFMFVFLEVK